jgi:dienelactone hydrolase
LKLASTWVVLACVVLADTALGSEEQVSVPSLTLSDHQFLAGQVDAAQPVTLAARLTLPDQKASRPVAAIVLLHGSDGAGSAASWNWANIFARAGYASLRVDSYTARGRDEIYTDQGSVGEFANVVDGYAALAVLAADERIDAKRVAVMGFSRGGIGALYSAMRRFETVYASPGLQFAAHLPFYPPCNFALENELDVGPEPIRAFHGDADVWNPLPVCKDYIDRLAATGHDASITIYSGAHHSFDHPGSPSYNVVSDAQTSRSCFRREIDGLLTNVATGQAFSWSDDCVEMGPAVQMNPAAMSAAERDVLAFLADVFGH